MLLELKSGVAGATARRPRCPRPTSGRPLQKAADCALHRHFSQLAATLALFKREKGTLRALKGKGVVKVSGVLLYVDDAGSQKYELPTWWARRGEKILDAIG